MNDGKDIKWPKKKKLKVNIFDKNYSLLVENEDLAAELAKYVNNMNRNKRWNA